MSRPMGARNAGLAGDSVPVFGGSVRGKDEQQQQQHGKKDLQLSDELLGVIKTYFRSSPGVQGCFSARLLTEEWAGGGNTVRRSVCLGAWGGFSGTGCALWFIVLSTPKLANLNYLNMTFNVTKPLGSYLFMFGVTVYSWIIGLVLFLLPWQYNITKLSKINVSLLY